MIRFILTATLFTTVAFAQEVNQTLFGVYYSTDNRFERYSTMILSKDYHFIYKSGLGGCQVEVIGTWTIKDEKIWFTNDKKFLGNDTIRYPDLSLTTWTIKRRGIRPDELVDSGCVKEHGLFKKR